MDFVAIDVETANSDMASICQIGIATFSKGELIDEWVSLINPGEYFDPINISIHGITESCVTNAPSFSEVFSKIASSLSGRICVSHTHFDRVSIDKTIRKNSLMPIELTWLDSARVARRVWDECAWQGYGLANVCKLIGYKFKHHDALEDAKASGAIINAAIAKSGITIESWLTRVGQPIGSNINSSGKISLAGNPEGELYGQNIVFTGTLTIPRTEAASMASSIGCSVTSSVTNKTDYVVVGDQDSYKLAGKEKSAKHIKAEDLISKGAAIRILKESDFKALVSGAVKVV